MTLRWRFGSVACTALDKLDKLVDKMRAPRRVRTRGAAMQIWATKMSKWARNFAAAPWRAAATCAHVGTRSGSARSGPAFDRRRCSGGSGVVDRSTCGKVDGALDVLKGV